MQAYASQTWSDSTVVDTLDRPTFIFNFHDCSSPSPLSALQGFQNKALQQGKKDYNHPARMDQESLRELHWWIHEARKINERLIVPPVANIVITSDASQQDGVQPVRTQVLGDPRQDKSESGAW